MKLGQGDYQYEVVDNWAKLSEGWDFSLVSDVAIDSLGVNRYRIFYRQP